MTGHLGEYALLGDLHTAALVSDSGALDWLCLPRFDSAACFTALTGEQRAGSWRIGPAAGGRATRRQYRRDTLILETEWDTPEGSVRLVDCMPPRDGAARVVRVLEGVAGEVPVHVRFAPRFDDGRRTPWLRRTARAVSAVAGGDALWLDADVPFDRLDTDGVAEARFTVPAGQRVGFVLTHTPSHLSKPAPPAPSDAVEATERFWSAWLSRVDSAGPWESAVRHALVTLKALTHAPTGAVVTAPAFPPHLCMLRDASSTLTALLDAGLADEARAWREWLVRAVAGDTRELSAHYTVDGRGDPARRTGRQPVGEVLYGLNLADDLWLSSHDSSWDLQLGLLDHLESTWHQTDTSHRHLVHAKVMAWAGVDRALRTAARHGLPCPLDDWRGLRSRIRAEVCAKGYDPERNTFTRYYGSDAVDPALLLMPEVGFLPWRDVRVRGTVAAVGATLCADVPGEPVALTPDSPLAPGFWLAAALYGTGNTVAARALFDQLLTARNDVGLFGELYEVGRLRAGLAPHTTTTVSMINAAHRLRPASTVR